MSSGKEKTTFFDRIEFHKADETDANNIFLIDEDVNIKFDIVSKEKIDNLNLSIIVKDSLEAPIFSSHHRISEEMQSKEFFQIDVTIPSETLIASNYTVEPILHVPNSRFVDKISTSLSFSIEDNGSAHSEYHNADLGKVIVPILWHES
ncbi:MAG: hypothetical protein EOO46_23855 [Flavobacterium sp.]|nr:MAG: hypothetical protein EOO46_23855 [Flavobacterium sp.]